VLTKKREIEIHPLFRDERCGEEFLMPETFIFVFSQRMIRFEIDALDGFLRVGQFGDVPRQLGFERQLIRFSE